MRVVIATPFYPPQTGVLATYASGIETALKKKGHDVHVVVFESKFPPIVRHLAYVARLLRASNGASFVLSLDMWSVGVPAYMASRISGVPLTFRIGGDQLWEMFIERTGSQVTLTEFNTKPQRLSIKERFVLRLFRSMLAHARHIFFNSDFQKKLWETAYDIPSRKTSLLENYYPARENVLPATNRVFVAANRKTAYKNDHMLERVFARVQSRHPEISLDTSIVPHQEHLQRLASSYAVLIPSVSEVNSNIAIESVVRSRPFIITQDTGTKERLANYGLYIDTRSEAALEEAIETLLDPVAYDQLASKARVFSFTHSWDEIADEILVQAQGI